jgi:hypothetical protein
VFNAGDVLFGSLDALAGDLSAAALRDETAWMTAAYVPLGAFSFLEAVALPFGVPETPGLGTDLAGLLEPQSFADLAGGAGLRGVFKLWGIKLECGWYADWAQAQRAHKPYLSLQGHLLADWNLSAVLIVPFDDPQWRDAAEWLAVTAGVFHLARLGGDRSLTLRLEGMLRPGASWSEASGAQPAGSDGAPVYGLLLFPEAVLALSATLSLQLRALVSPVDGSGLALLGAAWSPYQGLTLSACATTMAGDADDLYRWETWGPALTLGAEFVF